MAYTNKELISESAPFEITVLAYFLMKEGVKTFTPYEEEQIHNNIMHHFFNLQDEGKLYGVFNPRTTEEVK